MKRIFNIIAANKNDTPEQVLSVRAGEKCFSFSISSRDTDELLQLTWYTADEMNGTVLQEIYIAHPELRHTFYKTLICYDYPSSLLIPDKHYKEEDSGLLIEAMYGKKGNDTVTIEPMQEWQLKNIYRLPREVRDWMQTHFPSAEYHHSYSIGIKQISAIDFEGSLIVDFRTDDFLLIVSRAKKLLLAQTFSYSAPADVIYYLLKACREFNFSQKTISLSISGLIEEQSALYTELYKYFLDIRFRKPDWRMPQVEGQEYPSHFFSSFNDLALCAL